MAKQIILDGKVLEGIDQYGEWGVKSFEGWWDVPEGKGEDIARPNTDGDFDTPVYYGPRYPTLTGIFIADTEAKMFDGMNRFNGLLRAPGRLQVIGYGSRDQWADVKRASGAGPTITPATDTICHWQIRAKAPDSRKFGLANTYTVPSGSSYTTVFHRGNAVGYPVIKVSGSMPGGYRLQSSGGAEYRVETPLVSGAPHTIDMATGLLQIGGNLVAGGVTWADIWRIPGASTDTDLRVQPNTSGSATATVTLYDTYI